MRQQVNKKTLESFFKSIAQDVHEKLDIYFTGGVTALLHGWRQSTIDIDLILYPEIDAVYQNFPKLKDSLNLNIEIVSPAHFIPELPQWRERSVFIEQIGKVSFYHYDLYSQALAKIERGHTQDMQDVKSMVEMNLIDTNQLADLFRQILPGLYKYPAIDQKNFEKAFDEFMKSF